MKPYPSRHNIATTNYRNIADSKQSAFAEERIRVEANRQAQKTVRSIKPSAKQRGGNVDRQDSDLKLVELDVLPDLLNGYVTRDLGGADELLHGRGDGVRLEEAALHLLGRRGSSLRLGRHHEDPAPTKNPRHVSHSHLGIDAQNGAELRVLISPVPSYSEALPHTTT